MKITLLKKEGRKEVINRVELVEMIGETFRRPKETEQGKWWSLGDISQLLANRYANFDPETPFQKIGNALNDVQFNFKSKRKTNHMEY